MACHRCKNSGWVWYKTSDPENSHDKELCPDCFGISKPEGHDEERGRGCEGGAIPVPEEKTVTV